MSAAYDSFTNRGEYFAAHYFAEELNGTLRKGILDVWTQREGDEHDQRKTPRQELRSLRGRYLGDEGRSYFASIDLDDTDTSLMVVDDEWRKKLADWHREVLRALGYPAEEREITVHRAGRDHQLTVAFHSHDVVAVDCGWATDNDEALDPNGAARLLHPLRVNASETYETGPALVTWLFQSDLGGAGGPHPRFVLLLAGGVIILADRQSWNEGRYLAANLDAAFERYDRAQAGELATIAALYCYEMLRPGDNDPAPMIDKLLKESSTNAVGVSSELRYGLQRSVEIIANEILRRMAEPKNDVRPADIESPGTPFARELTRECLRYLYRVLFLLYAEARPELGILPADDDTYDTGYSMARLRELVARDEQLVDEEARNGFHLFLSLDVLFDKVNFGHRAYGTEDDDDKPGDDEWTRREKAARRSEDLGLRFEALRSKLFEPTAVRLIGTSVTDPRSDDDAPRKLDLRLRNEALHEVLRLLTLKKGRRGQRGGFISYRNLGINQLGAVYEGLMSYTGIIADQELCEVAKDGKPEEGSWLIPAHRQDQYPNKVLVQYGEDDARHGLRGVKRYPKGSFVYRLAGRDRETSASYYTPESLTKVTVELALKELLDQERDTDDNVIKTRAAKLLSYKICEPALGSGAFLNEAINQVAEEYLRRRQDELGKSIPTADLLTEKQRVKAYIALHNAYGVDLNDTGVELAEVSLWLNTMHPGMQAPWFGLHLRRGNSLIGGRRAYFDGADICSPAKEWLKAKGALAPTQLPFLQTGEPNELPQDAVHHFLLPAPGWAAVSGSAEAKKLATEEIQQLAAWKRGILQRPSRSTAHLNADGTPKLNPRTRAPKVETRSQFTRLRDAARRVEFLWSLVIKRLELSERDIARRIPMWGADPNDPEFSFIQQPDEPMPKEKVLQELFEDVDTPYWRLKTIMDTWCALWFWPANQVGLLDGTDSEYTIEPSDVDADALAAMLGATGSDDSVGGGTELDDAVEPQQPSPLPATPLGLFRATTLFPVDGEQTAFDDLGWGLDSPEPLPVPKGSLPAKPRRKTPARRPLIPLKTVNDWLDFLESMLGTSDVPGGTIIDSIDKLPALKDFEKWLLLEMKMDIANPEMRYPWLRVVRSIAEEHGFLHWELDFARIFAANGGFHLQVGNPPWVRPQWDDDAALAENEPWFKLQDRPSELEKSRRRDALLQSEAIRGDLLLALTDISAKVAVLGSPQMYPLLVGTQPDLYRGFMCISWSHMAQAGAVGLLHPDTHFNGDREALLRSAAYKRLRIHGDFVNAGNRFFPHPVGRHTHFGVHIYGPEGGVGFDHLSWLFSVDALRNSSSDDGKAPDPSVRFGSSWDERPHLKRIVHVTPAVLEQWRRLVDDDSHDTESARLLSPVSIAEAVAISALADFPLRVGALNPQISAGFHEAGAKAAKLIDYNTEDRKEGLLKPTSWSEVILKGPQLSVANPMFKQPSQNAAHRDFLGLNLNEIGVGEIPETEYVRRADIAVYRDALDKWIDLRLDPRASDLSDKARIESDGGAGTAKDAGKNPLPTRPYTSFYRLAWRRQIAPNTERSLYSAIIPPGPAHVDAVHSMALPTNIGTALLAGFWAALPLDYFLRVSGRGDLRSSVVKSMPAPEVDHPLAGALLLRILRLNCLTNAYADLWAEAFRPEWQDEERWACRWPGMMPLGGVEPVWTASTPLRTERSRRATLVEIDALVSVWLGVSLDSLKAMYRARFPVLQDFESVTWFDSNGRKIAGNRYTYGYGQDKSMWEAFERHLEDPRAVAPPHGYAAPFYKADREQEFAEAHAAFQSRLDAAVAGRKWEPIRQEVERA